MIAPPVSALNPKPDPSSNQDQAIWALLPGPVFVAVAMAQWYLTATSTDYIGQARDGVGSSEGSYVRRQLPEAAVVMVNQAFDTLADYMSGHRAR